MTEAEKMAEEFVTVYKGNTDRDLLKNAFIQICKLVAERTRLECAKAIEREKWLDRLSVPKNSVINARWEDDEV